MIGRTQTNGPDYDTVRKVQDGYTITRWPAWAKSRNWCRPRSIPRWT